MPTLCASIFSFFNKACSTMSGISFLNGTRIFLPIKSCGEAIALPLHISCVMPLVKILTMPTFCPWLRRFTPTLLGLIMTLNCPLATPARSWSGERQIFSDTSACFASLPCNAATAMVTLGIAGAPYTVNCSLPAANSEGETPAAASAAVIFKKSRLFISIFYLLILNKPV